MSDRAAVSRSSVSETLDEKVRRVFGPLAIDKRRLPMSQLSARGIPAYVAEWVLESRVPGYGPLSAADAAEINAWASRNIPIPTDQGVIKHRLSSGETVRALTPVRVEIKLKRNKDVEKLATLSFLGIEDAYIDDDTISQHQDLLRQGMWGIVDIVRHQRGIAITRFRPMQAQLNLDMYKDARRSFTTSEWLELMLLSMGYSPNAFSESAKLYVLSRLLPLVQKSMHLMELAPKGTGKSYVFENIHPKVRLVSGGNISPAVLFVNNASGQWGLLARFAAVVLDEVQTLKFEKPAEIIGGLKGYLANGLLTRGGLHQTSSDCGLVLLANVALDESQQPVRSPVVSELPEFLRESAFVDRMRGLIPGWRIPKLTSSAFAQAMGLKSDFFGDTLLALREDFTADQICQRRIQLTGSNPYKRNHDAIVSIASGMMKILFPDCVVTNDEFERYCVAPAVELRQGVWDQLYQIDAEYRQYDPMIKAEVTS